MTQLVSESVWFGHVELTSHVELSGSPSTILSDMVKLNLMAMLNSLSLNFLKFFFGQVESNGNVELTLLDKRIFIWSSWTQWPCWTLFSGFYYSGLVMLKSVSRQNANLTKCKQTKCKKNDKMQIWQNAKPTYCKYNKMQIRQNANETKCKPDKMQIRQNANET